MLFTIPDKKETKTLLGFARRIKTSSLPKSKISKETRVFLENNWIDTLENILNLPEEEIKKIPISKVQMELHNLRNSLIKKTIPKSERCNFSQNIPAPRVRPNQEELITLKALLFFEFLFGNRRNVTKIKHEYLPRLYQAVEDYKHYSLSGKTKHILMHKIAS